MEFNFEYGLSPFLFHGHSSHYPKGLDDTHSLWSFVLSSSQFSVRIGRGFLPARTDEPPEPGCTVGRIGIVPTWNDGENWGLEHCQTWFIKVDGSGFDGNLLLRAVVGNCPDEAAPISDVWQRHVEKTLAYLIHKTDQHDKCLNWL